MGEFHPAAPVRQYSGDMGSSSVTKESCHTSRCGELELSLGMNAGKMLQNPLVRNIAGFLALLLAHAILDWDSFINRQGAAKVTPYVFLLLMYGWIVFHNRILFDRLFLKGKKVPYVISAVAIMTLCSWNMHYILTTSFGVARTASYCFILGIHTNRPRRLHNISFSHRNTTPTGYSGAR
jgi:hypothetical protein